MTYDDYLDGTSKMAIQALVLELDEAVRGAAEKAVAPAVDQVHATLRRLSESDEALRRELAELATRLPSHMQTLLEAVLVRAAEPAWQLELRETVQGGLAAQYQRLSEASDAIRRLEGELATLARTVGHQGSLQEAGRARIDQVEQTVNGISGRVTAAIERTEETIRQLAATQDGARHQGEARIQGLLAEQLQAASQGQDERFAELAGLLGQVRENLGAMREQLGPAQQEQRDRLGMVHAAVEALGNRVGAVAQGVQEALGQLERVETGVHQLGDRVERLESAMGETREAALAAERAANASESRLQQVEDSLLAGVLEREKRLSSEVRQIMQEIVDERVAPVVRDQSAAALAPVTGRLDAVESQLGQIREECQTRHDALVRMLDNLNGRVVFDVEAQSKNAHQLERLRRQSRWQLVLSMVMLGAVGLLFAFTFVLRTGMLNRF